MRIATRPTFPVRGIVGAVAAAAVALVVGAGPASASGGASDPPGWSGTASAGEWVAFTVSPTTAVPIGRTGNYQPVTITRESHLVATPLATAFAGSSSSPPWPMRDTNNDGKPDELGWPEVFSDGNVTLTRVAWCVATDTQCSYQVTNPGPFRFAGGDPPVGPGGTPDYSVFPAAQPIKKAATPDLSIKFSWDPSTAATPANGSTPGKLTLDASGSSDQFPGQLVFEWKVTRASDQKTFTASPNPTAQFDLDANAVYCVSLKVTNTADSFSKEYGVGAATDCKFVDKVEPQAPAGNGGGGGGSGVGGIPTSGGAAAAPTVVFAPPRQARSALTGGGNVDSSVIWLWRPEWFQPSTQTQTLPQTGGRSDLKGRTDIVVSSQKAPASNASPWLAGLAAFGLIGIGWVLTKRRQVRADY